MRTLTYCLLFVYFLSNTFAFRFQRTTLSISREVFGVGDRRVQAALTPSWIRSLGLANTALWVVLSCLIFKQFHWLWAVVFIGYVLVGTGVVNAFMPFPTHGHCFRLAKRQLLDTAPSQGADGTYSELLARISDIQLKHNL